MSRPVSLYPGGDPNVYEMPQWADIHKAPESNELWLDLHGFHICDIGQGPSRKDPDWSIIESAEKIVVFDWFHGEPAMEEFSIDWVKRIANRRPLTWITLNPKAIPGVRTVRFDYYWNRTKQAFWDKKLFHKLWGIENFEQYPLHSEPRSHKYLTYHYRTDPVKNQVWQHLISNHQGFYNDWQNGKFLHPNRPLAQEQWGGAVAPPGRYFFDQSYVTCLTESQYRGPNGHVISEKTYDSLIQGRAVLNFATPGFYQQLVQDGWQLPQDIDWSWNEIVNDDQRLQAYLDVLDQLFSKPMHKLHQWFMDNWSVWQHNRGRLMMKPYDIIDFGSI